jgi:gamma-glutamylcysteine synthetase
MTVAAFHLGLQGKVRELRRLLKNDTTLYHSGYNAVELRRQLVRRELPSTVDPDALYALVQNILDLCREGLSERGQGEEVYLEPLYQRTENRTNPAKEMLRRLQNGESMENVIKSYAEV